MQHDVDAWVDFTFNQRGPGLAYYRDSGHGTDVYTHLETGGTYTNVFSFTSQDHVINGNGDDTLTILVIGTGNSRWYDTDGNHVLHDAGQFRCSFDVEYNGTLTDPSDDQEIEGSFQVVRESTGRNDTED